MAIYKDDPEYGKLRMVHAVVDMLEIYGPGQKSVKIGLLGMDVENDLGYPGEEDIENSVLVDCQGNFRGFPGLPDEINKQLIGEGTRYCNGKLQPLRRLKVSLNRDEPPRQLPITRRKSPAVVRPPPIEPYESPAERRARLLEEERKTKEKAEKKRIKKQKQKERKRLERMEQEKLNPEKSVEVKDDSQRSKAEDNKGVNDKSSKNNSGSSESTPPGKRDVSRDTDSRDSSDEYYSDDEDSDPESEATDEELDLTSSFVSKAAIIAARQLEQKAKSEKREKKKPLKEETQPPANKSNDEEEEDEDNDDHKKESTATSSNPSVDDYIKRSTEMALLGNRFASAGQFDVAVKYFTDAIKYNPREFRLFGNRAFCFEKMQEYEKSLTDAELSLNMCPSFVKGLFRKGRALAGLQRYREAAQAFKEVLKLDSSCTDAAQELMRVQITQLMAYGFSREQSSNALIIHGTVDKALEVLSKLNGKPGSIYRGSRPGPDNMAPVPAAAPKHYPPPQAHNAPRTPLQNRPKGPPPNMSLVPSHPKTYHEPAVNTESPDPEPALFPIWVGNLVQAVTEAMITDLFSSAGEIHSVKILYARRCAFVNYTNQDHCDEAILQFHGHELMGIRITVRYPDRIPRGLGMSKAALKAIDLPEDNPKNQKECFFWRNMGCTRRPTCPYRHVPENRGIEQRNKPKPKVPCARLSQE